MRHAHIRWIISAALIAGVSGCAVGLKDRDMASVKKIGVLSSLGDTFHLIHIGTTVFQNTTESPRVPEWQVDKFVAEKTSEMLRAAGFESRAMDAKGLSPGDAKVTVGFFSGPALTGQKRVLQEAREQGFDTLILLTPRASEKFHLFRPGYGFYSGASLFSAGKCVYTAYSVYVYAVESGSQIAWTWGGRADNPCDPGSDNDLAFKASFADYSSPEKDVLRQRLERRMEASMKLTISGLFLEGRGPITFRDFIFGKPKAK
jgi:hypothetical protein